MDKYKIERHDSSSDNSLRAWSAADEYLVKQLESLDTNKNRIGVYNDRFGFLAIQLHAHQPLLMTTHKSQEKSIKINLSNNKLRDLEITNPLDDLAVPLSVATMKIPKSLDLFKLFLDHICRNALDDIIVLCGFMTRHFTPQLLSIANEYFDVVEQSLAVKKARILKLSKKKIPPEKNLIHTLKYNGQTYHQYFGVFSASHIDYATQFFLDHLVLSQDDKCILDLASGNGIIANVIYQQLPHSEIHLMDDSYLAVSSAKLNVTGENIHHHYNNELSIFQENTFDLIVTNPPFHFEYEININIPLSLFKGCYRCLKSGGKLQIVASRHLNYKVHLEKIFSLIEIIAQDKKFIIYKCTK